MQSQSNIPPNIEEFNYLMNIKCNVIIDKDKQNISLGIQVPTDLSCEQLIQTIQQKTDSNFGIDVCIYCTQTKKIAILRHLYL